MNIGTKEDLGKNNIVNHERQIEVPCGWNRCLENDSVVYFSPTQVCLRSKEDIARYLISDRTCKCGLDCPLYIDKIFNFDASIPSCHVTTSELENEHKTLCKETIKARFAALVQMQAAVKQETGVVSKPVVIKKKSEVSAAKGKNEKPTLSPFSSLSEAQILQEQEKPKKPRKSVSNKQKMPVPTPSVATGGSSSEMRTCQTVHSNVTPILHSSVEKSKDLISSQYSTVSTGYGGLEHPLHPGNQSVAPILSFPSTHLNASSFLASLSSGTARTPSATTTEVNQGQKIHPFSATTSVEHGTFGPLPVTTAFPVASNQPKNLVYVSNQTSKVNWQGSASLPQNEAEKSKGGFTMKAKVCLPKIAHPYTVTSAKSVSCGSVIPVSSSLPKTKSNDLPHAKGQTSPSVKAAVAGRCEPVVPGYTIHNKSSTRAPSMCSVKPGEAMNQPVQYCGILLQPGMVPHVQLAGAGPRPVGSGGSQGVEQNQYGNLYTLQGIPYGNNVAGNPTVLGMTPNTVIPYFLGIAQPGTSSNPKPIVPATTSTSPVKESSPASSAPVSTSAIAAAYSAFVSIAPAGPAAVTNCSFSQQLVNLVSNYNNPYWQHLLTQGGNSSTLAYQLMQIGQYSGTRSSLPLPNTKSLSTKALSHGQTKLSSSKSSGLQGNKPKNPANDSVPSTSTAGTTIVVKSSASINNRLVSSTGTKTAVSVEKPSVVNTATVPPNSVASSTVKSTAETSTKTVSTVNSCAETSTSTVSTVKFWEETKSMTTITTMGSTAEINTIASSVECGADTISIVSSMNSSAVTSSIATVTAVNSSAVSSTTLSMVKSSINTNTAITSSFVTSTSAASSAVTSASTISETNDEKATDSTNKSIASNTPSVCTHSETVASTEDQHYENSPGNTNQADIVTESCSEEASEETTNKDDNTALHEQVSKDTKSQEETSETMEVDSVHEHDNKQSVDSHTSEEKSIVKSDYNFSIRECKQVEKVNDEKECGENPSLEKECINNDKENDDEHHKQNNSGHDDRNDNTVSEAKNTDSCVVETETRDKSTQDGKSKGTDSLSTISSNDQNCNEDVRDKDNEGNATPIDSKIQNGETESVLNDTKKTKDGLHNDTEGAENAINNEKEMTECPEFTIGDVVWAQARGLPSWPGKIVDERDVGSGKSADIGKKWVMWFGDHTFSQVEVERLKTLTEGLKTLDDKGRKRKYRGKKSRIGLEKAIGEALEELDTRDRLRSRQGPKAKKRRL